METFHNILLACSLAIGLGYANEVHGKYASWDSPGIDVWTYPSPQTPGVRTLGPTFISSPGLDANNQFNRASSRDPARRGMTFAVFETATELASGLDPARYQVDSATITFTLEKSTGGFLQYDDAPESYAELLSDYVNNDIDTARPMELYGVGLQAGYTGFALGEGGGEQPYSETDYPYSPAGAEGVLSAYPIATDATGAPVDVSNSFTGGYSATSPDHQTDRFDPTPWAIGTAAGLEPGDVIPNQTTFSFEIDLSLPGVAAYVQQRLSDGALGFYLSSLHFSGNVHDGETIPYPQWYMKEFHPLLGGVAPTLELDFTVLPIPGDFDADDDVDATDLSTWESSFGRGAGADADRDGDTDGADVLAWLRNYSGSPPSSVTVPEPSAAALAMASIGVGLFRRRSR